MEPIQRVRTKKAFQSLNLPFINLKIARIISMIKTVYIISPKEKGIHPKVYLEILEITG